MSCRGDCINFSISKVTSPQESEGMAVGDEHGGVGEEQLEVGEKGDNSSIMPVNRKEKRKSLKKMKRKQLRKEMAEKEREEEERRMNDPEVQRRLNETEEMERLRIEMDRKEFEERERKLLEEIERQRQVEEEEAERRNAQEEKEDEEETKRRFQASKDDGVEEDSNWEYVEEGPPEIIWQGNEIIVRKKRVRVPKKHVDVQTKEDANRPTSNPLPPEPEASSLSAQEMLKNVAQEVLNFGTEQDKAHCPFHLKTGSCRFGQRCSRVHFYPDKACTLLIKNMYNGPGLAWEQDEGLECTDEEVERTYEEFYEDVHTEFLKYGQIVNFKVCRNSSFHLRGNVYVHYKSLDSAGLAYQFFNGRYFAGRQVTCEFVNITRWKVAICGEYMKSRLQNCSRGSACNFIHCFRNPGGDYQWADWDKPPPRFWMEKMTVLFGCSEATDRYVDNEEKTGRTPSSANKERARYSRRSMSRDFEHQNDRYGRKRDGEDYREEGQGRNVDNGKRRSKNIEEEDDRRLDYKCEGGWSDRDVDSNTKREYRGSSRRARSSGRQRSDVDGHGNGNGGGRDRERESRHSKSKIDVYSRRMPLGEEELEDDGRHYERGDMDSLLEKETRERQRWNDDHESADDEATKMLMLKKTKKLERESRSNRKHWSTKRTQQDSSMHDYEEDRWEGNVFKS